MTRFILIKQFLNALFNVFTPDKTVVKWLFGLLVLLLVYFIIRDSGVRQDMQQQLHQKRLHQQLTYRHPEDKAADYYIYDLIFNSYDHNARRNYSLTADKLLYFRDQHLSLLTQPDFIWFNHATTGNWFISADKGQLLHATDLLKLQDQVKLNYHAEQPVASVTDYLTANYLTTDYLDVLLDQNLVITDARVNVKFNTENLLHSRGMRLTLTEDRVEFLNQIKTTIQDASDVIRHHD